MAYVLYTPPTHAGPSSSPRDGPARRAIGRIAGPLAVGYTQYRIGGTWHQKAVPTTDESLAADTDVDGTSLFLRGGHWHFIREETIEEMSAAGLDVGDQLVGLYPSFYPSADAYPGA